MNRKDKNKEKLQQHQDNARMATKLRNSRRQQTRNCNKTNKGLNCHKTKTEIATTQETHVAGIASGFYCMSQCTTCVSKKH
jgi:hypothetical protein